MTDLISRADAIEAICNAQCELDVPHYPQCDQVKWCDEVKALLALPSADAVQGEWIMHIDDLFPCESTQECSVCHAEQPISISDDNYCPNCGARMKGGDEE